MQKMYTFFSKMPDQACALTASTLSCAGVENSTRDHDSDFSLMDGRRGELCMQAALQWLLVTLWESGKSITCLCAALHLEHSRFKTAPQIPRRLCVSLAGLRDNPTQWHCAAMRDIHIMSSVPALQLHHVSAQGAVHHAWAVRKTRPE
jgi:hypothetical protein